jgi:sugar lactone lactonase YvrE
MGFKVECVLEKDALLGEGPLWDPNKKILYWIDILKQKLHAFNPSEKTNKTYDLQEAFTAIALRKNGSLLATLKKRIAYYDPDTKTLTPVCEVEGGKRDNRFNDAKCDRRGRFWAGTMNEKNMKEPTGALYRFDFDGKLTCHQESLCLSNGLGWSPDNSVFYLVESFKYAIFAYDFDIDKGTLSGKRQFASVDEQSGGCPDGMTVDGQGYVWSAQPGLGRVVRYHPSGKIDQVIEMPVLRPSSCIFGGENLDTLYIPTARELMSKEQLEKYPLSGSLFAIHTGVKGIPETCFEG